MTLRRKQGMARQQQRFSTSNAIILHMCMVMDGDADLGEKQKKNESKMNILNELEKDNPLNFNLGLLNVKKVYNEKMIRRNGKKNLKKKTHKTQQTIKCRKHEIFII